MKAALRTRLTQLAGMSLVDDTGRPYGTITRPTVNFDRQSLVSDYEVLLGDLRQVLFKLTKDKKNIRYVVGKQVTAMKQSPGGPVTVEFTIRFPTTDFDRVVACDRATSRTRALGLQCGVFDHMELGGS